MGVQGGLEGSSLEGAGIQGWWRPRFGRGQWMVGCRGVRVQGVGV